MRSLRAKSKAFAVRCVRLCRYLSETRHEHRLSPRLLRSGTRIGADVWRSSAAQTRSGYLKSIQAALPEAYRTANLLERLYVRGYLSRTGFDSIYEDCQALIGMLEAGVLASP